MYVCKYVYAQLYVLKYYVVVLQKITSQLKIKATNGKELPAVDVFAKSLEYIKVITLAKFEGFENPARKILWIITVPAIWSLAAKQIMKEASCRVRIICMYM